jgi:type I restriction enzyme, S subunit
MSDPVRDGCVGDYVTLQRGNTYKSALLGRPGPVLLGLGSIARNGGFKGDNLKTYGGSSEEKIILRPGDIYVSLKDVTQSADLLGAVSRVPSFIEAGRLTQDTVKLEFKTEDAPRNYIYWLLRTPEYRAYCKAHSTGTTNLGLAREDFFSFPVPALNRERATVVAIIQSIEDRLEINRQMNETLEAMARAAFKDWFVDFGPTRAKMEGREPYLANALWSLFPDVVDGTGKPAGWKDGTLADVAKLNPESWGRSTYPDQIRYVDLSNTKWGTVESAEVLSKKDAPSRAQRILRSGDTIVGMVRPGNGSYAFIDEDGLTGSTGFAVLRPKHSSYREFIYLAATSTENIDRLAHQADGGAYPAVRPEAVISTAVLGFDETALKHFSDMTSPLIERIEANKRECRTLVETRDLLLPKLMSGEVRLKQTEGTR